MPAVKVPSNSPLAEIIRKARGRGKSKYKAVPVLYDGVRYGSKVEAAYAKYLDERVAKGEIPWWLRQVRITLGVAECVIVVDFLVPEPCKWHPGFTIEAHEIKGNETPKFKRDKRLWLRWGPFPLRVIKPKCHYKKLPDGTTDCTIKSIESYTIEGANERTTKLRQTHARGNRN